MCDPVVREGMQTPWGAADYARVIADGIGMVGTPGHGGYKLSRARNARVPAYMRREGGWYEEDCDWCIPYVVFEAELRGNPDCLTTIEKKAHVNTFRNWHPDAYERWFKTTLKPGESTVRDEQVWKKAHAQDWQGVSASGDWHASVPKGMVGVMLVKGGRDDRNGGYSHRPMRYVLVTKEAYAARDPNGFIAEFPDEYATWDPDAKEVAA